MLSPTTWSSVLDTGTAYSPVLPSQVAPVSTPVGLGCCLQVASTCVESASQHAPVGASSCFERHPCRMGLGI